MRIEYVLSFLFSLLLLLSQSLFLVIAFHTMFCPVSQKAEGKGPAPLFFHFPLLTDLKGYFLLCLLFGGHTELRGVD